MKYIELENQFNTKVILSTFGASIVDIKTVDYKGNQGSIVTTPINKEEFKNAATYFGKTIGRTGGRISNSRFTLNNKEYIIKSNDPNGLHGGIDGLSYKDFDYKISEDDSSFICTFSYNSPDLESGYPGNLALNVIYKLYKKENKLTINYLASCDKDTLLNLSNHTYFNLNAESGSGILDHYLYINASKMEEIKDSLPNKIIDCEKIYSFKNSHQIKDYLFDEKIISNTKGYDNPYIFDSISDSQIILYDDVTKRKLTVSTSYPAVVVYTCNYPEGFLMNNNRNQKEYDAICLECMYLPNTINSDFLSEKKDILRKGNTYNETIIFKFN